MSDPESDHRPATGARASVRGPLALAAGGGVLSALAFPPAGLWGLALVGLAPLFLAVWAATVEMTGWRRVRRGFLCGWVFGVVFFGATLWWVGHVTVPGTIALCCYLALYPAVAAAVAAWLGRPDNLRGTAAAAASVVSHALIVAGSWTALEWIRSFALSGFEWNGPAVPLIDSGFASPAEFVGVHGLTAVPVVFAFALAAAIALRARARIAAVAVAAVWLAGAFAFAQWVAAGQAISDAKMPDRYRALLVQPNVPMNVKMSGQAEDVRARWSDLVRMTDAALAKWPDADLVVWPESAIPWPFHQALNAGLFDGVAAGRGFTLVTGADAEMWGLQNCLVAMRGRPEEAQIHGKVRLVPFGEFIPFRRQLPFLEAMLGDLIPLDFDRGTSLEPLQPDGQPFEIVPLVCFEDTIGGHARQFVRPTPQAMVNVTNDNWFHRSPGTEMHFANARWRAVELQRPLLRSANTGVTAAVRPDGSVQDRLPSFEAGVLSVTFRGDADRVTFFARHGHWFCRLAGVLALAGLAIAAVRRRRVSRATAAAGDPRRRR